MKKYGMTAFGANLPTIMILLLVGLIILAIIVNEEYKLPSNFKQKPITGIMKDFFLFFGIPADWLYVPAMIYLFFVPFLGIFVIVYGFLSEMNIFPGVPRVNIILALLFAFATIPIGAFVKLVSLMFAVLGIYSVGAFGLLFFLGVIYVIITRFGEWGFIERGSTYHGLRLENKYEKLRRWMLDTYRDNMGTPNERIVRNTPEVLREAENTRASGDIRRAIQLLESASRNIYANLRRSGGITKRPP